MKMLTYSLSGLIIFSSLAHAMDKDKHKQAAATHSVLSSLAGGGTTKNKPSQEEIENFLSKALSQFQIALETNHYKTIKWLEKNYVHEPEKGDEVFRTELLPCINGEHAVDSIISAREKEFGEKMNELERKFFRIALRTRFSNFSEGVKTSYLIRSTARARFKKMEEEKAEKNKLLSS